MKKLLFYLSLLAAIGLLGAVRTVVEGTPGEGLQRSQTEEADLLQALTISDPAQTETPHDRDPLDQGADNCPATVIPGLPYSDTGTTTGRTNNWNTAASCAGGGGGSNAPDVIYSFTPAGTGNYVVSTCGSVFNTLLEIRTGGACPGATQYACADGGCSGAAELRGLLTGGVTYYIIVDGYSTISGNYTLTVAAMCNVVIQAGDLTECAETVDSSHARLDCNGGPCNAAFGGAPGYWQMFCGQSIFGKAFTYTRAGVPYSDTDWYHFSVTEVCTVRITAQAEFPSVITAGAVLPDCEDHGFYAVGYTCLPYSLTIPNVPPGEYEFTFRPWDAAGIPASRDYRLSLECIPVSGCVIDATLNAPATMTGNTTGAGNDCSYESTADRTIRVNIPVSGAWEFSLCGGNPGWEPIIYLKGSCCSDPGGVIEWSNHGCETVDWLPVIECRNLDAGTYYLTVEGRLGSEFDSGPFTLSVDMCTGCVLDGLVYAPGSFSGNTCGASRDCGYTQDMAEEETWRIVIPDDDDWVFDLTTGWYSNLRISHSCCGPQIAHWYPDIPHIYLTAGVYYLDVAGNDSTVCGSYSLDIYRYRGSCCYGAPDYQFCVDTSFTVCEALGGIFRGSSVHCADDPCRYVPPCPEESQFSQRPYGQVNRYGYGFSSDKFGIYQRADDFELPTAMIGWVRFWGMIDEYLAGPTCPQQAEPFRIRIYADDDGQPGTVLCEYNVSLPGIPVNEPYAPGEDTLFQYETPLSPPCAVADGWISVVGADSDNCVFFWAASPFGDDHFATFRHDTLYGGLFGQDLSFCLGGCPPADSVVLKHNSGNMFILSFWAPVDANYKFYYTTSTTAEYPTGFTLASQLTLTSGHQQFNLNLTAPYQRWLIVTNCQ